MFTHGGFCGTKHNLMAIKRQHWTTTNTNEVKVDTPTYYDGKKNYTAIDVVTNFDLNYNLGTACTYILRAYKICTVSHIYLFLIKLRLMNVTITFSS